MVQSVAPDFAADIRKEFYTDFLEFARRCPGMKVSLQIPADDLPFLSEEGWFSIVCDLLDLCEADRLAVVGMSPGIHLFEYLYEIKRTREVPVSADKKTIGSLRRRGGSKK